MDLQTLLSKSKASIDQFLVNLKPEEKSEILQWLTKAEEIRNDANLNDGEKRTKIGELKTNQVILNFFKSFFDQLSEKSSVSKLILETAAGGATAFFAARYVKTVGVALVGVQLAIPYIMTSESFGGLLDYLKARLTSEPIRKESSLPH